MPPTTEKEDDYYQVLGAKFESTEKEIGKAYRSLALKFHPDKNPGDEFAAMMFLKISKAYSVLSDEGLKKKYDEKVRAKMEKLLRDEKMDSKRRKLKEDLEAREQQAKEEKSKETASEKMQREIERARELKKKRDQEELEARRIFEEAMKRAEQETEEKEAIVINEKDKILKVKWDKKNTFGKDQLMEIFGKYGEIDHILVSEQKRFALVSFKDILSAHGVMTKKGDTFLEQFKINWGSGSPPPFLDKLLATPTSVNKKDKVEEKAKSPTQSSSFSLDTPTTAPSPSISVSLNETGKKTMKSFSFSVKSDSSTTSLNKDFESVTLMKMRQMEERKRLEEELLKEKE